MEHKESKIKSKIALLDFLKKKGKSLDNKFRLPPGQKLTASFPILDLGIQPEINIDVWKLKFSGLVKKPLEMSLEELKKLGVQHYTKDFHCVTSWSKFDVHWTGIPFKNILEFVKPLPNWKFLIQHGKDGYSTNVPRIDVERDEVFLAFELDNKPISKEHGYVRLIIPHLYGWKASKFLVELEFSAVDKPGFWEIRGYHNHGDAFNEERY